LAYGSGPQYATFRDNDQHRYAEAALKRAGILYSDHGLHHAEVSDDVLYMLSAEILTAGWRSYCPWRSSTSALRGVGIVVWSLLVSRSALFAA
jgi:hypothetical protein